MLVATEVQNAYNGTWDEPQNSSSPWCVLRAETGWELEASSYLDMRGIEFYVPSYQLRRKLSHKRAEIITRALFPGYIFARFPRSLRTTALQTPRIFDYLRSSSNEPAMIDNQEVERVKIMEASHQPLTPWNGLVAGKKVRVRFGTMAGMYGVVVKVPIFEAPTSWRDKNSPVDVKIDTHFVVNVEMLGRAVSVVVEEPTMLEAA